MYKHCNNDKNQDLFFSFLRIWPQKHNGEINETQHNVKYFPFEFKWIEMSFTRLHVLIMHIKNRAKNVGVRKVAKLLCFVLALSLNLHSFSFHASRLAIIKACCDLPEGCFALWNNHEPLNNASLQLCFHISWTNFTRPSAPGTTASSHDHTHLHNFSTKAGHEIERERESERA